MPSILDLSRIPKSVHAEMAGTATLFVALSGGADSVLAALLSWVYRQGEGEERSGDLRCLHYNHALRGRSSDDDEAFVRRMCGSLGVECVCGRASWSKPAGKVTEADARAARLAFFEGAVREAGEQPGRIVSGHHSGDIAESMLMRLARGSGLQGLCAPRPVSRPNARLVFLRPLLAFSREEIQGALLQAGARWREDESNAAPVYQRNRLRRTVIPAWEAASDRPLASGVTRARQLLEEDWQALEVRAQELWEELWDEASRRVARQGLAREPRALQRRLLQRLAARGGVSEGVSAAVMDTALDAVEERCSARISLSKDLELALDADSLRIDRTQRPPRPRPWGEAPLPEGCTLYLPDGGWVASQTIPAPEPLRAELAAGIHDDARGVIISKKEKQSLTLFVRCRRPGDAFKPNGKSSAKKLKTLLIDRKIELGERDRLPVLTTEGGEIVWVPGLPPGAGWLLTPCCTSALRLTYAR